MKIQTKLLASLAFVMMSANVVCGYEVVIDETLTGYIRNNQSETVEDLKNNLMWQDDESATTGTIFWEGAKKYCQNLNFAGYSDWRLPSLNELKSIIDSNNNPSIKKEFKNAVSRYYWSSTPHAGDSRAAWDVSFNGGGGEDLNDKRVNDYVRCVRDSK